MDAIKQQLLRIQEQLGGLSATQKMLTATLAAVMVMTVLWYGRYAAAPEMAPLLDQPMGMEDLSRIKGYLAGNHITYRLEGDRIFVPADRQLEALIDLGGHNMLPKDTSRGFDEIITKMTPWDGQARTRAVLEHGKEQFLSQILASFPNVATADVVINTVEERRIGGGLKPSASVRVRTKDGRADRATAQAVADFVANAVSGLEPEKITVVMNGLTQRIKTSAGGMSGDDFLESRQKAEELFAGKIEQQLFFIPGIRATVTVKLNDETSTTHSKTFDDVRQSEAQTESVTESTKNPPLAAAEPGVVAEHRRCHPARRVGRGGRDRARGEPHHLREFPERDGEDEPAVRRRAHRRRRRRAGAAELLPSASGGIRTTRSPRRSPRRRRSTR